MEGSIQKTANDNIRVTAQLIDAVEDRHLWAERYDRPVKDIFAVRDDITRKLVVHIAPKLTEVDQTRLERTYAGNVEAYQYQTRGVAAMLQFQKERNLEARQLCEKALEIDPAYPVAYSCVGWTYFWEYAYMWTQDPHTLEQAWGFAQKALALDESLPPAHELMAAYYWMKREYDQSIAESQRTIVLSPNWGSVYAVLGIALNATGRATEAIPMLEQAIRLNPRSTVFTLMSGHLFQVTEFIRLLRRFRPARKLFCHTQKATSSFLSRIIKGSYDNSQLPARAYCKRSAGECRPGPAKLLKIK